MNQPTITIPITSEFPKNLPSRKPYTPPAILHELELETRAGTAIGPSPDGLDPLGLTGLDK